MSNQGADVHNGSIVLRRLQQRYYVTAGAGQSSRNMNEAGAQTGYMHLHDHLSQPLWTRQDPHCLLNLKLAQERVQQVLAQYDFIVVVERIQESLVALQLLLHLETTDILYLSSKVSGGYSYIFQPNPGCHKLSKPLVTSPIVEAYLSSSEFYAANYQDILLYKAANASLDLTIASLGPSRFQKALFKYQEMMKEAKECESEAIFQCDSSGVHHPEGETNCYKMDWGCGYPCLDRKFGPFSTIADTVKQ